MTVNIEEKDTHFLYTMQINGLQYREYQQDFWRRAVMWTLPVQDMASKRGRRSVEEGVREDHHSIVVVHTPHLTVLVDGRPVGTDGGFGADGLTHSFDVEAAVRATYTLTPAPPAPSTPQSTTQHPNGLCVEGGGRGKHFVYALDIDGAVVRPLHRPPLLPSAWKADGGVKHEKVKEEMDKTKRRDSAGEKHNGDDDANVNALNRRVSEVDVNVKLANR